MDLTFASLMARAEDEPDALGVLRCLHIPGDGRCERSRAKEKRFAPCQLESVDHCGFPSLPVLSLL